jgi:hypothetical protein
MSDSFRQAYEDLVEFIRKHPEIEIHESVTSIPEHVRTDFYHRFNAVRKVFIEERFSGLLRSAGLLQQNYAEAERGLSGFISWEETPETSRVRRFLLDISDSMVRELFDPLFDLLKGKETSEGFERTGIARVSANWPDLFQGGYEKWAVLSLIKLLEPDKFLRVNVLPLKQGERAKSAAYAPWDDVPPPKEAKDFFFSQPRNTVLSVPDLIVHSTRLNRFVGFRSEFSDGLYKGLNPSQRREWLPLDTGMLLLLESGLTLVYVAEEPEQIAMIADATRFCRPDLILLCLNTQDMERAKALEMLSRMDQRVAPRIGSLGILTEAWPEPVELDPRIRFLDVGFDSSRLQEVIMTLAEATAPEIT